MARFLVLALALAILGPGVGQAPFATVAAQQPAARAAEGSPIYVVYYWRARPGKTAEYAQYIRHVAEPIDEEGRKAGVFEEVHTYTPAVTTGAPGADWTHMRVFRLKNFAALDAFGPGLDAAAVRAFPDEQKRKALMAPAAELRDLVRQEIWRELR